MSLAYLPDDLLGLISDCLNGFDNCSLWMASDLQLRQRLVNNIITDFYIKYTIPGTYLWPGNFLKKLKRLYHLSFVVDSTIYHLPIENIELFPIPTLKSLTIDYNYINDFLRQKNSSIIPTGPATTHKFINLNDLFCNLEILEFAYRESFISLIDIVSCLPKKLKTFSVPSNSLHYDPDILDLDIAAMLPPTLTELHLDLVGAPYSSVLVFTHLPNLTSLTTNLIINETDYHLMPKNLTSLITSREIPNIDKLLAFLPPGLRNLSLRIEPDAVLGDDISRLENLEHLQIFSHSLKSKIITAYPPNLTRFHGTFSTRHLEIPPLPDGITDLHLDMGRDIDRSFLTTLPQTLTSLTIYSSLRTPIELFSILPKNLRYFDSDLNTTENLSLLPDSLISFIWHPKYKPTTFACDRLPSKLETFDISLPDIESSIFQLIPETCICLRLESEDCPVDDQVIAMLPRSLKMLMLTCKFNITDASVTKYPPQLEYLSLSHHELGYLAYTEMSDNSIAYLPRSLTFLQLENPNLSQNCIKHLPPKLVTLNLRSSVLITWKCWQDLPKYINVVRLGLDREWSIRTSLEDMKEFLKHFDINTCVHGDMRYMESRRLIRR